MSEPIVVLALSVVVVDLLRILVFGYLWQRESAPYLRLWTLGFIVQTFGQLGMVPGLLGHPMVPLQVFSLGCVVGAALLVLRGTWRLRERVADGRWWLAGGLVLVGVGGVLLAGGTFVLAMAVPMVLLAFAYFTMGLALFHRRREMSGLGVGLTITALITTGLHFADFPVLGEQPWFLPWGIGIHLFNEVALTIGLVVLHFDRTHAARELADARYAELADTIGVGTYEATPAGRFSEVNGALARMLGYASPAEVVALDPERALYFAPVAPGQRQPNAVNSDVLVGADATWRRKDGRPVIVQLHGRALYDAAGQVRAYRGFVVDRTEAHGIEETLRRTQKLDAVGRLAGGVAHDFNNLLSVILSSLELLAMKPNERGVLSEAMEATDQAAQLTRRLLAFGRKQASFAQPVEVGATVLRTVEMLGRSLGDRYQVDTRGVGTGLWTNIDAGHLEQALVNLVLNAKDAMGEGGVIEVSTRSVVRSARTGVELAVKDHGHGMTPEQQARIFEPFFTTREPGRGTGLGLSTVHGIVSQAGGSIDVESTPGQGSRFALWFPDTTPPAGAQPATPAPASALKTGRVLVVDDEAGVRRSLCRMLEAEGYRTAEAASGNQAVAMFMAGERFEVMLSDVRMPDGDGPSAARQVKALAPSTRVVLMTGYQEVVEGDAPTAADVLLAKPFTREVLLAAIEVPAGLRAAG